MMRKDGYYAGTKEPAAELIEDYAREHGIGRKDEGAVGKSGSDVVDGKTAGINGKADGIDGRSTGFSGRISIDVFGEGIPPLFSKQGIGKFNGREQMVASGDGKAAFDMNRYYHITRKVLEDNKEERGYWPASEDPGTVRFNEPDFSESRLALAFDALAMAKEHMLVTNEKGERLADLGTISLVGAIAEYQARGLNKHKLAEWAIAERQKAVESAERIFKEIHEKGSEYSRALSALQVRGETDIPAVSSLGPKGQAMAKAAVEMYVEKVSMAGIIKVGESMPIGNTTLLLEAIEEGHVGGRVAIIRLNSGGRIRKMKILSGQRAEFVMGRVGMEETKLFIKANVFGDSADIQLGSGEFSGTLNSTMHLAELLRIPSSRQGALEIAEKLDLEGQFMLASMTRDIELYPEGNFAKRQRAYAEFFHRFSQIGSDQGFGNVKTLAEVTAARWETGREWAEFLILKNLSERLDMIEKRPRNAVSGLNQSSEFLRGAGRWLDEECRSLKDGNAQKLIVSIAEHAKATIKNMVAELPE
jgi:hypothetical protein